MLFVKPRGSTITKLEINNCYQPRRCFQRRGNWLCQSFSSLESLLVIMVVFESCMHSSKCFISNIYTKDKQLSCWIPRQGRLGREKLTQWPNILQVQENETYRNPVYIPLVLIITAQVNHLQIWRQKESIDCISYPSQLSLTVSHHY